MANKGKIRLVYRKIIDAAAENIWEKYVFDATYAEFLMQSQLYNAETQYHTFSELRNNVPKAEKLHFLVSASVTPYLQQLNGKMPDVLNNLGKLFVPFGSYKFEIVESDIRDKSKHRIAIELFSKPMTWIDTIGNQLLVSVQQPDGDNAETLTELFAMQPYLSIHSIKLQHQGVNTDNVLAG
ncbi:hypothetical protein BEL04_15420 [Mucilaginibacter sp. PPCGB 2223]|uniref:hypothetical protein n=1 Tax=Mucilaginibacter sp. PPCGB 2223 TaxID=1886027 RepID=UPI0008249EF7|nr:hypothetical protein [Mucilaginibacter sp. PPCGB 2223]OCX51416.1 hypothetical protein BEL04_15420 [Mucilaginibacter sp. PPCGB 2223]